MSQEHDNKNNSWIKRALTDRRQAAMDAPFGIDRRKSVKDRRAENNYKFITFKINSQLFGIHLHEVTEVLTWRPVTYIPRTPKEIAGVINLRGSIITAVDMRYVLNEGSFEGNSQCMNIIIKNNNELYSLLADEVSEVCEIRKESLMSPPQNITGNSKGLIIGVFGSENNRLTALIDTEKLINNI